MMIDKEHEGRALALAADVWDARSRSPTAVDARRRRVRASRRRLQQRRDHGPRRRGGHLRGRLGPQFAVHVKGTFLTTRAALEHLGGGASIINQGSVAALVGVRDLAAYSAAKGRSSP